MFVRLRKEKTTFFKRFLISYVFILLIPLLLTSFAYNQAVHLIEENAIDSRLFMLRHIRDTVDKLLMSVDEKITITSIDIKLPPLLNYRQPREGSPEMYWFWEYSRDLTTKLEISNVIDSSFFIFLNNNETVFSSSGKTYFGYEEFYAEYFTYPGMDYSQWREAFFKDYSFKNVLASQAHTYSGTDMNVITYLYSIPMGVEAKAPQGVIACLINTDEIVRLLDGLKTDNTGWTFITDSKGTLICGNGNNSDTGSEIVKGVDVAEGYSLFDSADGKMLFVFAKSEYNDWIYSVVLPLKSVLGNVQYIKQVALAVAGISLITGILLSLFLAYRNTKPFKDIVFSLKEFWGNEYKNSHTGEKMVGYDFLQGSISNLIHNNKLMQDSLQSQTSTLKKVFLERLFKGEFDSRKNMESLLAHVGIEINGARYAVITVKSNRDDSLVSQHILDELNLLRSVIEDTVGKYARERYFTNIINENEMALLLCFSEKDNESCVKMIKSIIDSVSREVLSHFHIEPLFGIGGFYSDLFDVHYSFWEARQALSFYGNGSNCLTFHQSVSASHKEYLSAEERSNSSTSVDEKEVTAFQPRNYEDSTIGNTVIWYDNLPKNFSGYFYPGDLEQKLISYVKSGSWNDIENALDKIYDENFQKKPVSNSTQGLLFSDMQATILKLMEDIHIREDDIRLIPHKNKQNASQFFNWLKESYRTICDEVVNNKKSHNSSLKDKIVAYIDTRYTDPNVSVCSVASCFNLSESYFSQFFKEQTGENFSYYVENLRIQHACRLLAENTISIEEIALLSGYTSANSFRRAFKRVLGITPSAYISSS